MNKLIKIQGELKSPKNQYNQFGKYNYRSCEDILEAVKPLLIRENLLMNISDEMVEVGGRVYCKATVTLIDGDKSVESCGWAREAETQKGMADAQITGSSSSYARKYGLNAMYLIDDTKDDDFSNKHGKDEKSSYNKTDPIVPSDDPFETSDKDYYLNHVMLTVEDKAYISSHNMTPEIKARLDKKIVGLEKGLKL